MKKSLLALFLAYVRLSFIDIYATTNNSEKVQILELPEKRAISAIMMDIKSHKNDAIIKRGVNEIVESKDDNGIKTLLTYSETLQIGDEATIRIKRHILDATKINLLGNTRQYVLTRIFESEVDGLRYAESKHAGKYYPQEVWMRALDMLIVDGFPKTMKATLDSLSGDISLPLSARHIFLAYSMRYDINNNGLPLAENIRRIISKIPLKPEGTIPWDIYGVQNKRINYFSKEQLKSFERWNMSDSGGLLYDASLFLLKSYRFDSINQIFEFLKSNAHSEEQGDLLVMIAAEILSCIKVRDGEKELVNNKIIPIIVSYIDKMEDKGAWCYRNYAIRGVNTFFNNNTINSPRIFKEGGDVLATISRGGADEPPVTNLISLACNTKTNNSSTVILKTGFTNVHRTKWMLIALAGVLLSILALLKTFNKRRGD